MHCAKSVHIQSYSGLSFPACGLNTERYPYSVRLWENTDQNNSEYGHFLRSDVPYIAANWHALSHDLCFSKHCFLDNCCCAFS